jgi:hypothetical protein
MLGACQPDRDAGMLCKSEVSEVLSAPWSGPPPSPLGECPHARAPRAGDKPQAGLARRQ